jgi:hypothetical protein
VRWGVIVRWGDGEEKLELNWAGEDEEGLIFGALNILG